VTGNSWSGFLWQANDDLYVGKTWSGALNISNGCTVTTHHRRYSTDEYYPTYIGDERDSWGEVTVSGEGAGLETGSLYVGYFGHGTLVVEEGGVVSSNHTLNFRGGNIGYGSDSVATATVTGEGSEWNNSGRMIVGYNGNGTLNITDGGVVSNTGIYSMDYTTIGSNFDSVGVVTVTGKGSEWNNSGRLYVGSGGNGTLNIEAGGVVTNTDGSIGQGTVTVTGEGSEWNNSGRLTVGHNDILNITHEGTVNVNGTTWVAKEAGLSGAINFDNGTLNAGGLISSFGNLQGTGTINTHGLVSDLDLVFDSQESLTQSLRLDDPGQDISLNLEVDDTRSSIGVGYEGTATLHISGGINVESSDGYLGYKAGSSGTASVVGAGSEWNNSGDLYVGYSGNGTLNIESGGTVRAVGTTWVAKEAGSSGVINFDNGTLTTKNLYSSFDDLIGTGTVNTHGLISDIDLVFDSQESLTQSLRLDDAGRDLTINLAADGASIIGVGYSGVATLQVTGGIKLESETGYLGYKAGSSGTATVSGEGASWSNSEELFVANEGSGVLRVEAGGAVSNSVGSIGYKLGSTGTVTVTGGSSRWSNSYLYVGHAGNGSLSIADGGYVSVGNDTWVAKEADSSGVINFDNGTLTTKNLYSSFDDLIGTGTVNTHGLVSDIDLVFDSQESLTQSLRLDDAGRDLTVNFSAGSIIGVGYSDVGTLQVTDGITLESETGYLGYKAGSSGTATVSESQSKWKSSDEIFVGYEGSGTLNVEAGGLVDTRTAYIGYGPTAVGTVTVKGEGVGWSNGQLFKFHDLYVGYSGAGSLSIESGALVENDWSFNYIGEQPGSVGTVTVTGERSRWNPLYLTVGSGGNGTLNIEAGGAVQSNSGYIGRDPGSAGTVTVNGANSQWNLGVLNDYRDLHVGYRGSGSLNIESGGLVENSRSYIGEQLDSVGTVTVSGEGSRWSQLDELYVGYKGNGTLNIEDGGTVSSNCCDHRNYIGYESGAAGTVTVAGGGAQWTTYDLYVGYEGNGELNIEAGGVVTSDWSPVGYRPGSTGTVTVTGEGSKWNSSSSVTVYRGALNIEAGGVVQSLRGSLGRSDDSVGTVTVTGEGSEWNNSWTFTVGHNGTLNITDEGTVNNGGDTFVKEEYGSSGVINFDNGTLNTGGLISSPGNLQGTGTINTHGLVSDLDLLFDSPSSLSQSWRLDDPGQDILLNLEIGRSGSVGIGYEGTATLHISDGVAVDSWYGYLGYQAGSSGTATVTGEGSRWNPLYLSVGSGGNGTLNIEDGGVVSSWGEGSIGKLPGSVGSVTVSGEGSRWSNSGDLYVGHEGDGALNITTGGVVESGNLTVALGNNGTLSITSGASIASGIGYIGYNSGSTGAVTVNGGGSRWNLGQEGLYVGYRGSGSLNIESGGVVSVEGEDRSSVFIGYDDDSVGAVTVTGEGSEWNLLNNSFHNSFYIGREGSGTLNIESGGVVTVGNAEGNYWVGSTSSSIGYGSTVTVTGDGSEWNNYGSLNVEDGTLNIEAGGVVSSFGGEIESCRIFASEAAPASATVTGEGSRWNPLYLSVGSGGNGTLNIESGGLVESYNGFIGDDNYRYGSCYGKGTVTVTGVGSRWNVYEIAVERFSELIIESGGVVSGEFGDLQHPVRANVDGAVTVTGEGSRWDNPGSLWNASSFSYAAFTLDITDGGVVSNTEAYIQRGVVTVAGEGSRWDNSGELNVDTLQIENGGMVSGGGSSSSAGTVTVTGEGSRWDNSGELNVGTLQIENGGVVSNAGASVQHGEVTVAGEGSRWDNSGELNVDMPWRSIFTLNITDGGVVSNAGASIQYGEVTVAGEGSRWDISGSLTMDDPWGSVLNISDGGVVNVAGTTTLNYNRFQIDLSAPTGGPFLITDGLELGGVGGVFEISLADGFLPELGSTFNILDFNTILGSFTEMDLPVLEGGLEWNTSQLLVDGTLDVGASRLAGDFNNDGTIDAADFTLWQDNLGLSASALNGNGSGAATVVQADYLLWKTNFGLSAATGSEGAAAVPEPTTLLLALLAMVAAPLRVRCG
jgi:T5SS/PEP-CTERM-associated repeat protein